MPPKKSLRQRTLAEVVANGIKRRAATVPKHIVADTSTSSLSTELEEEGNVRVHATTSTQVVDNASGFQSDEEIVANGPNEVVVYPVTFEEFQQFTNCEVRVRQIIKEMWRTHKSLMEQEQRMSADMEGKWLQSMYERFYTHPLSMRERANLTLKRCSTQMRKKLLARASIKVLTTKTNEDNGSKPLRSIENAAVKPVRKKRKRIVQEHSNSESDTSDLSSRKMVRVTVVDSSSDELQLTAAAMVTQHKEASLPHEYVLSDTEESNPTDARSSPVVIEENVEVKSVEIAPGDNFTVNWLQFIIEPDLNSSSAQFPVNFQTFTHCSRKTEIVDNLVNALKLEHGIDLTNDEILKERIFKNYYKQFYTNPSIRKRFPMIFIPCPTCVKQKILRMPQENEAETALPSDTNENVPVIAAPSTEQCMIQQELVDDNQSQGNLSRGAKTQFLHKSIDPEFIANYIQVRGGKNPQKLAAIYERFKKEVLHQQSEEKTPEKEMVQILSVEKLCGPSPNISEKATTSATATEGQIQTYTYVERAKKLLSHKVDKLQTWPFLVRYYDGMKRTILSAIMQMTIEEFQRYTHVHGAPDIYSDVEALRYCYAVALVEPRVWPVHLYMRLVDLHHYLQSKQVEYEQLDLQHVSPKLLHWEELVATTNFDECVRFDYCKCSGETLNGEELLCERRENYYRRCWAHDQWLWQTPIVNETTLEQLKDVTVSDSGNQRGAADMHESTSSSSETLHELSYSTSSETDNYEGGPTVDTVANAIEECAVVEQSAAELANNHADDMLVDIPCSSSVCDPEDELKRMTSPSTSEHIENFSQDGAELPNFAVVDMPNTQAQLEALLADGNDTLNTPPLTNTTTEEDRLVSHPVPSPMQKPQAPVTSPKEAKLSELFASTAVVKQEFLPLKDLQFNLLNDEDDFECVSATDDRIVIESESMANCFDQLSPFMPIVSPTDLTSHHLQSQLSLCSSGSMTEGQQLASSLDISQQQQQSHVQEKEQTETENRTTATQLQENVLTLQEKQEKVMKKLQENKKAQTLQTLEKTQQQQGQQNSLTDVQQKSRQSCEQKKEQREQQQLQQSKEQKQQQRKESPQIEQQYLQKGQKPRKEERQELQTDQQQRKQKEQQQQRGQLQQNQQRQPIEQLQQPKDRLQQQQKQQQQRHKEQQQQLKVQLQKEMEQQQRQKEKQQQKQQPLEKPQQSPQVKEQPHKLQPPKERLQQPKAQLQQQQKQQLQQQKKQQLQQQNEEQQKPQQQQAQPQSGAIKQSSKSIVTKLAISNEFITVRKTSAPAKTKRKPVDTIVPQLTHEFRALQLLPASEVAKASKVVPAATQPMVTIHTNVQSFSNDTSLFNNTNLLRMVDQSKPQSQQRSPQPARQLHKQVNNKINAVGSTSGCHQSMVYRKLEFFDYFGQLTVDHIAQYQLHCIGIGQPYMRARVKCADGRRTFLYGDVLGALFARCPAPLLRDVQRLLDELGEYHYTSRRSAYAGRPTKAGCDDLRASVLCQFMRSAPIFTYALLRPDCDLWQRVEPVSPVTDETLVRQPHCSDLSAALLGSTLVRIAEFKSNNRAPL